MFFLTPTAGPNVEQREVFRSIRANQRKRHLQIFHQHHPRELLVFPPTVHKCLGGHALGSQLFFSISFIAFLHLRLWPVCCPQCCSSGASARISPNPWWRASPRQESIQDWACFFLRLRVCWNPIANQLCYLTHQTSFSTDKLSSPG